MVDMFKTNTKLFCKDAIEKLTKDWPGGSYLVLKRKYVLPRDRLIIAIGNQYNVGGVLSLIATEDTGSTKSSIPYLSNHPGPFAIFLLSLFLVPLSCLISLVMLMRLAPTANRGSLI